MAAKIGLIGLGDMGTPMARRLLEVETPLVVWTRNAETRDSFRDSPAIVADTVQDVFTQCEMIIFMLATADALDAVLGRGSADFAALCRDHTLIQMGTTLPEFSRQLETDILAAGGRYAEVPVSGSSIPAASGQLVAMQAGDAETLAMIADVIAPLISAKVDCGPVPAALQMKLAVNTCLAGTMFGLIEGTNLARQCGLDMQLFRQVMEGGQMASPVVKMKLPKIVDEDFATQASVFQTYENMTMMLGAAEEVGAAMPIVEVARKLQGRTIELGHADSDMIAAIRTYEELNKG